MVVCETGNRSIGASEHFLASASVSPIPRFCVFQAVSGPPSSSGLWPMRRFLPLTMLLLRTLGALLCLVVFPYVAAAARPNVLLITVDTFRPDHLGAYGYARETSPALDRFAAEGVLFRNAISSSSWTSPGLLSTLTGLWAPTYGVDVRGKRIPSGTPTMATLLREVGYAAPDILYLSSIPNLQNLGLTPSYADRDKYLPNGDEVLFRALEAYQDSTFFLYYHYRNLHLPYNPSPPYDRMFTPKGFDRSGFVRDRVEVVRRNVTIPVGSVTLVPEDREWIVGLYDGQVREMDETFFRPLYEKLVQLGLYEKTLVIVTADHGEELMDHGFIGHTSTSFSGSAFDELLKIPLVMTCPSLLPATRRLDMQVRSVDILPTVLDLVGVAIPETLPGRSLMPMIRGEAVQELPAFTEAAPGGYQATPEMLKTRVRTMRTSRWKLIHTHGPGVDRYVLYDLERDPEERQDVSGTHPEVVDRMRRDLHRWVLASQPATAASPRPGDGSRIALSEPIRVLFPASGDTFRYADVGKTVSVRWTGPEDVAYTIEYRVGEGDYHLEGVMPVQGNTAHYGPYTEEMWNMLALYNPWMFRVTADGTPEASSSWVTFMVLPTEAGRAPGRWAALRVGMVFAWGEAGLLMGGIGTGLVALLQVAGGVAPVDVISAGLMLAILAGLLRPYLERMGARRVRLWGGVLLYTGFIYATLAVMPDVWRALWGYTQGRIDYIGTTVTVAAGAALILYLVLTCRRWLPFMIVPPLAGAYAWLLMNLGRSPAERLHLAEYGLLSFLIFSALRIDIPGRSAYFWGWVIASGLGGMDELMQWLLPSRVFEWKDVGLNAMSCGLGMAVIALLKEMSGGPDR